MKKNILIYATSMGGLLILFKWMEYQYVSHRLGMEMYLGLAGVLFLGIGIFVGYLFYRGSQQKKLEQTSEPHLPDTQKLDELKISQRESEVLNLLVKGYSNQEIADQLFISIHTVKSHVANLYSKLDVKRRTQAIQKAKELNIIS
ncbi:MAG: LuxR C-terminal-related transcriptional regulator [Bacteroidota bacterium]